MSWYLLSALFESISRNEGMRVRRLNGRQRQAGDIPANVVDRAVGCENCGFAGSEGQAYQTLSGDFEAGLGLGRDSYYAALAGERRGYV